MWCVAPCGTPLFRPSVMPFVNEIGYPFNFVYYLFHFVYLYETEFLHIFVIKFRRRKDNFTDERIDERTILQKTFRCSKTILSSVKCAFFRHVGHPVFRPSFMPFVNEIHQLTDKIKTKRQNGNTTRTHLRN